jgi:hypothetical protein
MAEPVIEQEIKGNAFSWTPSSEQGLKDNQGYIWFVQAVDVSGAGIWSSGKQFRVNTSGIFDRMFERIKGELKETVVNEDAVRKLFRNLKDQNLKITSSGKNQVNDSGIGQNITIVGSSEGDANSNVYYGTGAGSSLNAIVGGGFNNSFFGYNAGYNTGNGDSNTFIGWYSGYTNTYGDFNTFLGRNSGYYNTLGDYNTFLGYKAGNSNTTGCYNTFVGYYTGHSNTTAYSNTFIGLYAGYNNTTGKLNTYVGKDAGYNSNGEFNVFIGNEAGHNETGSNKLYIENSETSSPLIYGEFDNNIVSINGKLGVGASGNYIPTHEVDVDGYVKTKYFMQASIAPQMRWYETDGPDASDFFKMNYHNSSLEFIWYDASSATTYLPIKMEGDGYVGINNTSPSHMLDVGTSGAYCNGGAWVDGSSIEFKENIRSLSAGDARKALEGLDPVVYNYKQDKEEEHLGFIAEEVPELVAMKDRKGLSAMDLVSVLTKVVQEQQKTINEERETNTRQNKLINIQKELLKRQNRTINDLIRRLEKLERE